MGLTAGSDSAAAGAWGCVARVDFGACVVFGDSDVPERATVRGRLMGPRKSLGNTVVVGDRVRLERDTTGDPVLVEVAERRNAFSRGAAGRHPREQVIAANLDLVVCVASLAEPHFSPGLTDRILAQSRHSGLPALLVLNKCDLAAPGAASELEDIRQAYRAAGCETCAVSARTGEGVASVLQACHGRRCLFVGHSGVGKSTLLNALVPGLALLAGAVNAKTGRGRHTTTAAWLVRAPGDLELVDTPGVRTFALWGIAAENLDQAYAEFADYRGHCRFGDCAHDTEPGCAIVAAVAAGGIPRRRYASFLKLRTELLTGGEREPAGPGAWG